MIEEKEISDLGDGMGCLSMERDAECARTSGRYDDVATKVRVCVFFSVCIAFAAAFFSSSLLISPRSGFLHGRALTSFGALFASGQRFLTRSCQRVSREMRYEGPFVHEIRLFLFYHEGLRRDEWLCIYVYTYF